MKALARRKTCCLTLLAATVLILGHLSTTFAFAPKSAQHRQRSRSLRDKRSEDGSEEKGLIGRFTSPRIDDPAMPLTEAGLVQVVGPTLQLFWLVSLDSPYPSWAQPFYDYTFAPQGAFVAPTLIHGAGLACCWLLGCLAARAYEEPNFRVNDEGDYGRILATTIKAGAFATGLLVLATQFDLYRDLGAFVQVGESAETDLRIYRALVELINDVFFEFFVLVPWRLFRSNFD